MSNPSPSRWTRYHLIAVILAVGVIGATAAVVTPRLVSGNSQQGDSTAETGTRGQCGREEDGGGSALSTGLGLIKRALGKDSGSSQGHDSQAADEANLVRCLSALRNGIGFYATEHEGNWPDPERIKAQLTGNTNLEGDVRDTRNDEYMYGPYLRKVPAVSVGPQKGAAKIGDGRRVNQGDRGYGWIYDPYTGDIRANTGSARDAQGRLYSQY